jgi:hypothetical protein
MTTQTTPEITKIESLDDLQKGTIFQITDSNIPALLDQRDKIWDGTEFISFYREPAEGGIELSGQIYLNRLTIINGKVKIKNYSPGPSYSPQVQQSARNSLISAGLIQ